MQRTRICPPIGPSETDVPPHFNVVIAYEDFETGKHAKKTYDFLAENLGHDCQLQHQMWKFDVLSIPKLAEIAARDATAADIIVVSCHGQNDLPETVKKWIESWVPESGNALALVALFDCAQEDAHRISAVRSYLASIAKLAGLEFFAQPGDWPSSFNPADRGDFTRTSELTGRTFSTLAGAVQREVTYPHWGINE